MNENITTTFDTMLRKAVDKYNAAVKKLCRTYNNYNEERAYKASYYLRGVEDTIKEAGYNVVFEYADSTYFSEITMFLITLK